jgi:predicted Ser/Thr protein kinase
LEYPATWKFEGIGISIPSEANAEFLQLVHKIARGFRDPQQVFEAFKSAFGCEAWSSSPSWSETDLSNTMRNAVDNAPVYVESLWTGMEAVQQLGLAVPSAEHINNILDKWDVPLVLDPPELRRKTGDVVIATTAASDAESETPTYVRGEMLGRGGFGIVYRVTRTTKAGEFDFAMKVLDPSPFVTNRERALRRFHREMQALRKLQHRGIVPHIEAGLDCDQKPYILMPLIEGRDLQSAFSGAQPPEVFAAFDEILNALAYAHAQKVVHRDLKPSNILVRSSDGQPIILDFGCAYLFDDINESDLTTTLIGSAPYIPSEVHLNPKHRTNQQDIYACGMMLYQVLGGRLPSPDDYVPIARELPGWPGIDDLIKQAIAPEKRRIASAVEFRKRLRDVARQC